MTATRTNGARPLRILLVSDAYPPLIGGADRVVHLLAHGLRDRGHVVEVITAWQPALPAREDDDGIAVHRVRDALSRVPLLPRDPYKHGLAPVPDPEATWRIRRIVKRFEPDVVHSYGWITYAGAFALRARRRSIPLVVSARDYGNVCAVRTLLRDGERVCAGPALGRCVSCAARHYGVPKGLVAVGGVLGGRRPLARRIDGLHSVSRYVGETMRRELLGVAPTAGTVPRAVIPSFRREDREKPADGSPVERLPDRPFILFVGALWRFKGVALLLSAYGQLRDPPPLVLIGTPSPELPPVLPAGVTVLTSVPHATVLAAWDRALFGVFPSIWPEPFGNVVHEAMSRGRAVIGTTPGGHADIVDQGKTGLLVPCGDEPQLVAAMQRLCDDAALRERMGRAAAASAQRFTAEAALPAFLDLYERAIRRAEARVG